MGGWLAAGEHDDVGHRERREPSRLCSAVASGEAPPLRLHPSPTLASGGEDARIVSVEERRHGGGHPRLHKEIQAVHSEGDQPWDFFGSNYAMFLTLGEMLYFFHH